MPATIVVFPTGFCLLRVIERFFLRSLLTRATRLRVCAFVQQQNLIIHSQRVRFFPFILISFVNENVREILR